MPTKQRVPRRHDSSSAQLAGQNVGIEPADVQAASDDKELVTFLSDFTMDELRQIPLLRSGARLQQNATYLDLRDPVGEPFRASGLERVAEDNWIVPKAGVSSDHWNRMLAKRGARPG